MCDSDGLGPAMDGWMQLRDDGTGVTRHVRLRGIQEVVLFDDAHVGVQFGSCTIYLYGHEAAAFLAAWRAYKASKGQSAPNDPLTTLKLAVADVALQWPASSWSSLARTATERGLPGVNLLGCDMALAVERYQNALDAQECNL